MKTKAQFIEEFKNMTQGMAEDRQNFLIGVLRDMISSIRPFYTVDGKEYYNNFIIENLVSVDESDTAIFNAYNYPNGKKLVKVNFTENNAYSSEYLLDTHENLGKFKKTILRFPMKLDNQQYNVFSYQGYLPRATNNIQRKQMLGMIDREVMNGVESGRPVQLYKSGGYSTIGQFEDHFTYGVWNVAEDGNLDFTPFKGREDESISFEDGKELLNFLYTGNVPKDNILKYDINMLRDESESEKK